MELRFLLISFVTACSLLLSSCQDQVLPGYRTAHVVLVSIDGPRWSETWGEGARQYIPHRSKDLLRQGVLLRRFYNRGFTYTSSGHTAMLTGTYQPIDNSGNERPLLPNFFQYWLRQSPQPAGKAWIISSKDKIEALADCQDPAWAGKFLPMTDCGVGGLGTGYREDSVTLSKAEKTLALYHPHLVMVHFKEPDGSAHTGDFERYLAGIRSSDEYVWQLWNYLQKDPYYAGCTTMIITNDHGRHLDGVSNGFAGHGDGCDGCRHIELLAMGPDFRSGVESDEPYELKDIAATIAELLHFDMPTQDGRVIWELFR